MAAVWTEERVGLLLKLWRDHEPAHIAEIIGGGMNASTVTRKASLMGLVSRYVGKQNKLVTAPESESKQSDPRRQAARAEIRELVKQGLTNAQIVARLIGASELPGEELVKLCKRVREYEKERAYLEAAKKRNARGLNPIPLDDGRFLLAGEIDDVLSGHVAADERTVELIMNAVGG